MRPRCVCLHSDCDGRRLNADCIFTGALDDFPAVAAALEGVYGVFVNIDGFTVGEEREIYAGMKIFEMAKMAKTVKHYVWSNLEYSLGVRHAANIPII